MHYNVGYDPYKESATTILEHERAFTAEAFRALCGEAALEATRQLIAEGAYVESYQDIAERVEDILVTAHGFRRTEYVATFRPFGWSSLWVRGDWRADCPEDDMYAVWDALEAASMTRPSERERLARARALSRARREDG